jgi:hypothetical protein
MSIRLPKHVFREGKLYVLRHPSGVVVSLGSSLLAAKASYRGTLAKLSSMREHGAIGYQQLRQAMWAQVDVRAEHECWLWLGPVDRDGYGYFRRYRVHRLAWQEHHRLPVPAGGVIRHSCDNPRCCNPHHLLVGSQLDNIMDRDDRFRTARGSSNGRATLTEAKALAIFAAEGTYREIGKRFDVSKAAVSDIKRRRTWCWLTDAISHAPPRGKWLAGDRKEK